MNWSVLLVGSAKYGIKDKRFYKTLINKAYLIAISNYMWEIRTFRGHNDIMSLQIPPRRDLTLLNPAYVYLTTKTLLLF